MRNPIQFLSQFVTRKFARRSRRRSLMLRSGETLEPRQVLTSAFVTTAGPMVTLVVAGDAGDNNITIERLGPKYLVTDSATGFTREFNAAGIDRVLVNLGDGHDRLTINAAVRSRVECGGGNDTVYGSMASDIINGGGDDDDYIDGRGGNDIIDTGSGRDTVFGGNGNDRITSHGPFVEAHGGNGDDYIQSTLDGADDVMYGDAGNDTLDGGYGHDSLYGGEGDDWVHNAETGDYEHTF
jgi:Ca2+-binding RTX toxin-like protein